MGVTSFVVCWILVLLSFFRRTSRRRALTRLCDERIDPIQNLLLLILRVWSAVPIAFIRRQTCRSIAPSHTKIIDQDRVGNRIRTFPAGLSLSHNPYGFFKKRLCVQRQVLTFLVDRNIGPFGLVGETLTSGNLSGLS